jgi:hypothetical protein
MHNSDYYREQAEPAARQEFLELAAACEEAADRWMTLEQVGKWRSDKLSPAIKRTDVTDFATTMMRPR